MRGLLGSLGGCRVVSSCPVFVPALRSGAGFVRPRPLTRLRCVPFVRLPSSLPLPLPPPLVPPAPPSLALPLSSPLSCPVLFFPPSLSRGRPCDGRPSLRGKNKQTTHRQRRSKDPQVRSILTPKRFSYVPQEYAGGLHTFLMNMLGASSQWDTDVAQNANRRGFYPMSSFFFLLHPWGPLPSPPFRLGAWPGRGGRWGWGPPWPLGGVPLRVFVSRLRACAALRRRLCSSLVR